MSYDMAVSEEFAIAICHTKLLLTKSFYECPQQQTKQFGVNINEILMNSLMILLTRMTNFVSSMNHHAQTRSEWVA